jgi:hypothetical protein
VKTSNPIGIGSQGWRPADRRVYVRTGNDGTGDGRLLARGQWERVWVVGETTRSWICSSVEGVRPDDTRRTFKIPKSGGHNVSFDARDVELRIWAGIHRHAVQKRVYALSPEQLAVIAAAMGYETMPSEPRPDGQPCLIHRAEGGWRGEPQRLLDFDGRPVDADGRPIAETRDEVRP